MSRRWIAERLKTGLIVLLTALAVFLGAKTGLFNDFFRSIPLFGTLADALRDSSDAPTSAPGVILNEAARPVAIVITDGADGHYAAKYDVDALGRAYERTSSVFGEALGSALTPDAIDEDKWREALRSPGVYFEYMSPVRLSVLAGWLGVRPPDGMDAYSPRRVCVTFSGENNTLYFEDRGAFYACETASPGGRPSGISGFGDNGALFAFEIDRAFDFAPYMLILPQTGHPILQSEVKMTAREMIDALLSALGVTGQLESSYIKRGDTLRFIDPAFTIIAASGGRVTLSGAAVGVDAGGDDEGRIIEQARVIVAGTIGKDSGGAEAYFDAIEYGDGVCTVTFVYHAAGGLVHMYEEGYAARITFSGGAITDVELVFRTFTETTDTVALLRETQALAAAGAEFFLCYPDSGSAYLHPVWVKMEGEA